MITFQREPWADYFRDCQTLWAEHYDEIAVQKDQMVMKPDVSTYMQLEASGQLDIITARRAGEMVGYILAVVRPHLHYADVLCGFEDAYFLRKSERRGMTGVRLIREWERSMRQRGARKIFAMTKASLNMGLIFQRLGFTQSDILYSKWLGEG